MKFFAPQNTWDVTSTSSYWPLMGSVMTASGVRVSEEMLMSFAPVFAAMRVISETMASFPLNTLEQKDWRTANKATEHPLYPLLHDAPNPEQDIMCFLDMQVAMQLGWGNAYSEIQRNSVQQVTALWPIHPSRIPLSNIRRNPRRGESSWVKIAAGQPGEIVYYVNNDDGSTTAIPASDMLHVPGVMSRNGITGVSPIMMCAESMGIALATQQHAGAYFRNGAVSNMAIESTKVVGKETAERLREQWQKVFGGVHNHYKTLLLEDGMKVVPFSVSPEASQLIAARQFGVNEVARVFRVPPHKIGDLSRSSFSNIEAENLSFIVDTMTPWVIRWEKAMHRQLLTPEEKQRLRFKFNMMGLLRGDQAARSAFYQSLFNMGAFSPNDIREREDENPIESGDQYFVPANNLFPLAMASEMAEAQVAKTQREAEPPPPPVIAAPPAEDAEDEDEPENRLATLRRLQEDLIAKVELRDTQDAERLAIRQQRTLENEEAVRDALRLSIAAGVSRLLAYEVSSVKHAAKKPEKFLIWRDEFYNEFRGKLTDALATFEPAASRIGFTFDASLMAGDYVTDSTLALEPLGDLPCGKLEASAEETVSSWSDRPARLANFIIPDRKGDTCAV